MNIRGFQKCKVHSSSLKVCRIIACHTWCILGVHILSFFQKLYSFPRVFSSVEIQSPMNAYKRSPVYAMKPATFNMIFHNVRVQPRRL